MRLLLDESLPKKLKHKLVPHEVRTVPEMGWAGRENGELLDLAQDRFDVFVTADQRLPSQQNVSAFRIAIIILAAASNRLGDLEPLIPKLLDSLEGLRPGVARVLR